MEDLEAPPVHSSKPAQVNILRLHRGRIVLEIPSWRNSERDFPESFKQFMARIFDVPEVRMVTFERQPGVLVVDFNFLAKKKLLLQQMAAALRNPHSERVTTLPYPDEAKRITFRRYGRLVTTWSLRNLAGGWIECRHPLLRGNSKPGGIQTLRIQRPSRPGIPPASRG